jgi:hypothetical protein
MKQIFNRISNFFVSFHRHKYGGWIQKGEPMDFFGKAKHERKCVKPNCKKKQTKIY